LTGLDAPANSLIRKMPASHMPVILPKGRELSWLRQSNSLAEVLNKLQKFPFDKMNAYPIGSEINNPPPFSLDIIKLVGERILSESVPQRIPVKNHYGHKEHDVRSTHFFNQS
jgi:hypothetical protein